MTIREDHFVLERPGRSFHCVIRVFVLALTAATLFAETSTSGTDCTLLTSKSEVHLRKGHIDNVLEQPLILSSSRIALIGPDEARIVAIAKPILQIAPPKQRLRVFEPDAHGVIRITLPPGIYVFSAVADGFQSVSGCLVIPRKFTVSDPVRVTLPLGV